MAKQTAKQEPGPKPGQGGYARPYSMSEALRNGKRGSAGSPTTAARITAAKASICRPSASSRPAASKLSEPGRAILKIGRNRCFADLALGNPKIVGFWRPGSAGAHQGRCQAGRDGPGADPLRRGG